MGVKRLEGDMGAAGFRFGIVAARFNSFITEALETGAVDALLKHGATQDNITIVRVPGSFEIPLACKKLAESGTVDAVITVGAVIRGDTFHYELVSRELASGLARVSLDTGVPVTFGVLTTDTVEHAIARSGPEKGNKGAEAALAAIEMVSLLRRME